MPFFRLHDFHFLVFWAGKRRDIDISRLRGAAPAGVAAVRVAYSGWLNPSRKTWHSAFAMRSGEFLSDMRGYHL